MADELKHLTVGTALSQAEYEAIGGHVFDSQAQGDILYASSTSQLSRLGKDANDTRALTNTGTNNNPVWAQIDLTNGVTDTLPVGNGGTGATTLTDKAVLISQDSGTDTLGSVALTTSGQVIIGGSSGPAAATLTAGSNVTITNGDGSISIAAGGGMASLAADTTPQVGGSAGLDLQAQLLVGNGGTTGIAISANGEVTMAAQPSFTAAAAGQNDETGDRTTYTVEFTSELFDQNADFSTSTFTAPIAGRYALTAHLGLGGIASGHTEGQMYITAGGEAWTQKASPYAIWDAASNISFMTLNVIADLAATETAVVTIVIGNAAKSVDISTNSFFSGVLVS